MRTHHARLAVTVLILAAAHPLPGCDDEGGTEPVETPPAIELRLVEAMLEGDLGRPDEALDSLWLHASVIADPGAAGATLHVQSAVLYEGEVDEASRRGELQLELSDPAQATLRGTGAQELSLIDRTTTSGALESVCGKTVLLVLTLGTSLDARLFTAQLALDARCLLDHRAATQLALVGQTAAGKPCRIDSSSSGMGRQETHAEAFGYDAQGRVWFVDRLEDGTRTERRVYDRTEAGYLARELRIDVAMNQVTSRLQYVYDAQGRLERIAMDGGDGLPDGAVDRVARYTYQASGWTSEEARVGEQGTPVVYTHDPAARTLSVSVAGNVSTVTFGNELTDFNQYLALAGPETELLLAPQSIVGTSDGQEVRTVFSYDGTRLTGSETTAPGLDVRQTSTWVYDCE